MTREDPRPSSAEFDLLCQVVRQVARAHHLTPDAADDFAQTVQLKLLERNYDVFERFSGRSSLRTYLTVVVTRLLLDWRNSQQGKWRPSAAATRLGDEAVDLERLIARDGYSVGEAIEILLMQRRDVSRAHVERVAAQLQIRPRRRFVPEETVARSLSTPFDDPVALAEHSTAQRRLAAALAGALTELPIADRRLILMRYACGCSVKKASELLKTDPKALYRRLESALRRLRKALVAAGITGPVVIDQSATTFGWAGSVLEESL